MNTRFSWGDLAAVAAAAALTAGLLVYVNTDDPDVIVKTVTEPVAPRACRTALALAEQTVTDAGATITAANDVSALLQDVYDAGAAGADIAPKVRAWAKDLRAAHSDLDTVPDRFDLYAQRCLAEIP